jgi:hypothetical protein
MKKEAPVSKAAKLQEFIRAGVEVVVLLRK